MCVMQSTHLPSSEAHLPLQVAVLVLGSSICRTLLAAGCHRLATGFWSHRGAVWRPVQHDAEAAGLQLLGAAECEAQIYSQKLRL